MILTTYGIHPDFKGSQELIIKNTVHLDPES